jgi:hypothetical protein
MQCSNNTDWSYCFAFSRLFSAAAIAKFYRIAPKVGCYPAMGSWFGIVEQEILSWNISQS